MKQLKLKVSLLLLLVMGGSIAMMAQQGTINPSAITAQSSSITLKTARALFPDQPVAVANELFGGLHSLATVNELHGVVGTLDTAELQVGMLVYLASANMYYRYKGVQTLGGADYLNSHLANVGGQGPALLDLDANNVDTRFWEALSDLFNDVDTSHTEVFIGGGDTTGVVNFVEGDIFINNDTTLVWVNNNWVVMSEKYSEVVLAGDDTLDISNPVEGNIYLDTLGLDTTYAYDGNKWLIISAEYDPSLNQSYYKVLYSLDAGANRDTCDTNGSATVGGTVITAIDMDDFRSQVASSSLLRQFQGTGSNGVILYYPAAWGDFFYSVIYAGTKISLTNGIDIGTTTIGGVTYKEVSIASRDQVIEID